MWIVWPSLRQTVILLAIFSICSCLLAIVVVGLSFKYKFGLILLVYVSSYVQRNKSAQISLEVQALMSLSVGVNTKFGDLLTLQKVTSIASCRFNYLLSINNQT